MLFKKLLNTLVLTVSIAAITATAQTPYEEGQKALREARWMAAANHFGQVSDAADADESDIAAAMYWRAHALYKADHRGDAARQVHQLEREYPSSQWLNEARALQIEYQGSIDDAIMQDELRLFALSQLLERDFNRALPLVIEIMNNTASDSVANDAMFLLGMSDSPDAQRVIAEIASDGSNPDLQADAISILAVAGNQSSLELLGGLYNESASIEIKQAVMHAYLVADQPGPLLEFLSWEIDPEMQRDLIYALGAMQAIGELNTLYPSLTTPETRMAAVEAFAVAGEQQMLMQILESETDSDLRVAAIHGIAIAGGEDAGDFVESIYSGATTEEEKIAVIETMMMLDNATGLISLIKQENDPGLRLQMMEILTVMDSEEATEFLFEMLENQG